jgi:hypothetical protein
MFHSGVWLHVLLVLVVVDVAALFVFFAMLVDGELLGDRRRRFSLRSLLLAMTFAAVNAGVFYSLLRSAE